MNIDDLNTLFAAGGLSLYMCLRLWSVGAKRDDVGRHHAHAPIEDGARARREDSRD